MGQGLDRRQGRLCLAHPSNRPLKKTLADFPYKSCVGPHPLKYSAPPSPIFRRSATLRISLPPLQTAAPFKHKYHQLVRPPLACPHASSPSQRQAPPSCGLSSTLTAVSPNKLQTTQPPSPAEPPLSFTRTRKSSSRFVVNDLLPH